MNQVIRICNTASAICTAGASESTSRLQASLDKEIALLVEGAQETTLVKIVVELATRYGDEESAALVMSRALAAASKSAGYGQ